MDGVDKFDQLLSYYRIQIKSKKLTLRLIFHAFDFACVNIWLEYKTIIKNKHVTKKYVLDMLHFKLKIADALIILNQSVHRPCGRPSSANSPRNSPISVPKRTRLVRRGHYEKSKIISQNMMSTRRIHVVKN